MQRIFSTILAWHLKDFAGDAKVLKEPIVSGTIQIYETITAELLPTPAKSHYTFNLRDLAKVFQGILQSKKETIKGPDDLLKLWVHECLSVFSDRLINDEDRSWFQVTLKRVAGSLQSFKLILPCCR